MLTETLMNSLWPHAAAGLVGGFMPMAQAVFNKYGLTTDLLVAHAMAQFSVECGYGTELRENLDYSAQGLMNTWPNRFDAAKAAAFANQPQKIANEVYGGRYGNVVGTDDGWNFRGRGASQLTFRDNYAALGKTLDIDLVSDPDLVIDPAQFLLCGVADFIQCGCLPFAQADDVKGVTYHLNGGYNGLAERTTALATWKTALSVPGAAPHGTLWVQQSLNTLGASPPLTADGTYGPLTVAAVQTFQASHGLAVDGKIGPLTLDAIETALAG